MNNVPLVSILCAAYNQEKYIAQTIEGFLMQKVNFPFEVIIHDDASTDKTAEIIRSYEEKYPDIIKGIYQTENKYSKKVPIWDTFIYPKATGKYFAECEGDDYWTDPNKLQTQADFLESHGDYIAIGHNVRIVDDNGTPMTPDNPIWRNWFTTYTSLEDRDYTLQDLEKGVMFGHSCTRMFRSSIQKQRLDSSQKEIAMPHTNGDVALSLRCFCKGKIRCSSLVAADHRKSISNDSWTSKTFQKNLTRRDILSLHEQENFANSFGIYPDFTDQQYRHVRRSFHIFKQNRNWENFFILIGNLRIIKRKFKFLKRLFKIIK